MNERVFYIPVGSPAMRAARRRLLAMGCNISDVPTPVVTHLLLDVPSLERDNQLRGGGLLTCILQSLPQRITVIGGNLEVPELAGYEKIDLLRDEVYLWENAAITADCAISLGRQQLAQCWQGCPVLILGWGRIARHLALTLQKLGCRVSVAARNPVHRASAASFGMEASDFQQLTDQHYEIIFNTAPALVLPRESFPADCVKIDLASVLGIAGEDVVWARGLPGKYAPESAGDLIVRRAVALLEEKEALQ